MVIPKEIEMAEWKVGDLVKLKSGGPQMTVTHVRERYGAKTIYCAWFVSTKKEEAEFPPDSLEKA